jgi:hypothetical protein
MSYRVPSPRDDYTIKPRSWIRFAHHKYPELVGATSYALYKKNATQWVIVYGGGWHRFVHEEKDLVPV